MHPRISIRLCRSVCRSVCWSVRRSVGPSNPLTKTAIMARKLEETSKNFYKDAFIPSFIHLVASLFGPNLFWNLCIFDCFLANYYQFLSVSVCLVDVCVCLSVCLSVYLPVCFSVCLSMFQFLQLHLNPTTVLSCQTTEDANLQLQ